jgi:hypothetical protein
VKYLRYICPECGKVFDAHIYSEVFERKLLCCADCGVEMDCAIQENTRKGKRNANSKTTGT